MGLSEITSSSRACHNLEGSLAADESKFLPENPIICRLPAKAEVIYLFFHDHMQLWSSRSCGTCVGG
jgi:hypothetical protein